VATNDGSANYGALQVEYRRNVARGLQATASYSWAHSIDNVSCGSALDLVYPGFGGNDRASSDFDARHSFAASFAYDIPAPRSVLTRGWAIHGMLHARSGFPVDVLTRPDAFGLGLSNVIRPDLNGNVPLWLSDSSTPGGRSLNPAAFTLPHGFAQGDLGRNAIRGFGMSQIDLSIRRQFRVSERTGFDVRVETFNALNQANFGDPVRFMANPLFGQPVSMLNLMLGSGSPSGGLAPSLQMGGARSVQLSLRLSF